MSNKAIAKIRLFPQPIHTVHFRITADGYDSIFANVCAIFTAILNPCCPLVIHFRVVGQLPVNITSSTKPGRMSHGRGQHAQKIW